MVARFFQIETIDLWILNEYASAVGSERAESLEQNAGKSSMRSNYGCLDSLLSQLVRTSLDNDKRC